MQYVGAHEAIERSNNETCIAREYPTDSGKINGAGITITGRYPDEGLVYNTDCTEEVYVISGSGRVVINGVETVVGPGGLVRLDIGELYFWDTGERLELLIVSTPAWYPEQHHTKPAGFTWDQLD